MGVHKPAISRIPAPIKSTAETVTFVGGSPHKLELARTTSAEPTTKRMRSKPVPGKPPANVEYRRRNEATFRGTLLGSALAHANRKPKKS